MKELSITQNDIPALRKMLPLVCLIVPWEIYQYSTGWGIKFSLFYLNFDMTYGTLAVSVLKQLTMLSYGGFAPSIRTIFWALATALCVGIFLYEVLRAGETQEAQETQETQEEQETQETQETQEEQKTQETQEISSKMLGAGLLVCGTLLAVSSFIVWSDAFRAVPVGIGFFAVGGYLLMQIERD